MKITVHTKVPSAINIGPPTFTELEIYGYEIDIFELFP